MSYTVKFVKEMAFRGTRVGPKTTPMNVDKKMYDKLMATGNCIDVTKSRGGEEKKRLMKVLKDLEGE